MSFSTQALEELLSNSASLSGQTPSTSNIICSLLGITPEELQQNPEAAQTAFLSLYTDLTELLGESTDRNPAQVEATRSRIRSLREALQAQTINLNEAIEELPENLREMLSSTKDEGCLHEIIAKLQGLADSINQPSNTASHSIDETIESLTRDFFIEEEKRLDEKRNQEYKQSAQDAIEVSFRSLGLPSFAGGDLQPKVDQQDEDPKGD